MDNALLRLECDGVDKTGAISIPNTGGYQNWGIVKKTVKLDVGEHVMKLLVENGGFNIDKMVFEEIN